MLAKHILIEVGRHLIVLFVRLLWEQRDGFIRHRPHELFIAPSGRFDIVDLNIREALPYQPAYSGTDHAIRNEALFSPVNRELGDAHGKILDELICLSTHPLLGWRYTASAMAMLPRTRFGTTAAGQTDVVVIII